MGLTDFQGQESTCMHQSSNSHQGSKAEGQTRKEAACLACKEANDNRQLVYLNVVEWLLKGFAHASCVALLKATVNSVRVKHKFSIPSNI